MRRSLILGLAALGLLAGCKGYGANSGGFGHKSQAAQVTRQASAQAQKGQTDQAAQDQTQQQDLARKQTASAPAPAAPGTMATETGKLAQVSGDTLLLDRGDKGQLPVTTDSATQVTIDGRQAALGELKPGADVRVAYQSESGGPVKAQRIEVTSTPALTPAENGPMSPVGGKP